MAQAWTEDMIERLKMLWAGGMSAGEIGKTMSISRNAAIGKAHRLGLDARTNPVTSNRTLFERAVDIIADEDVALAMAARRVGLNYPVAKEMWDDLCRRGGRQYA